MIRYFVDCLRVSGVEEITRTDFVLYAVLNLEMHSLMIFRVLLATLHNLKLTLLRQMQEENNIAKEQAAKVSSQYWKPPIYYDDDDDDEEYSIQVSEFYKNSPIAITSVLPTVEPEDSLGIGDEHLSTVPEKESDKVKKSSVEHLLPIPRESKDLTDYESECDMPVYDDSSPKNEGLDDIVYIPPGKEINHLDAIPDSVQSLLNRANWIIFLIEDDSLMEEIDIFLALDNSIPPGMENDDSKGDVIFLKELLNDDSISLPEYESFHVDFYNVPSSPRPPEKPPDNDVYFEIKPELGELTRVMVEDISDNSTRELYVHVPNVLPTLPTLYPVFETLLPFSSENEDKGTFLSWKFRFFISILLDQLKIAPNFEDSLACGFVLRSLELQSLAINVFRFT
nr:hypothetical protein [Tanacetum cinerariifolium]